MKMIKIQIIFSILQGLIPTKKTLRNLKIFAYSFSSNHLNFVFKNSKRFAKILGGTKLHFCIECFEMEYFILINDLKTLKLKLRLITNFQRDSNQVNDDDDDDFVIRKLKLRALKNHEENSNLEKISASEIRKLTLHFIDLVLIDAR